LNLAGMISTKPFNYDYCNNILEKLQSSFIRSNNEDYIKWSIKEENVAITYLEGMNTYYCHNNMYIFICGEIFNVKELEEDLILTASIENDSYVAHLILQGYYKYGKSYFDKLDGQFAIFIWDSNTRQLLFASDNYNSIPIYYYMNQDELYFSTYLPSLVKLIGKKTINPVAIYSYIAMQSIMIGDMTIFKEYKKLPIGSCLTTNIGNCELSCNQSVYFTHKFQIDPEITFEGLVTSAKQLLLESIESRCKKNLPCVWLSGGLDSSLLVAILKRDFGYTPSTFSIGFNEFCGEEGNEFEYSRYVAQKYNCDHKELFITNDELNENIRQTLHLSSEPMISNDSLGYLLLGKYSKQEGFESAFSGLGPDEAWYGYKWHRDILNTNLNKKELFYDLFLEYKIDDVNDILNHQWDKGREFIDKVSKYIDLLPNDPYESAIISNLNLILPEDPIKRTYNVVINNKIKIRAPFLSKKLIQLSLSTSHANKLHNQEGKAVLKSIASEYFDHDFIYREKHHFAIPEIKYASGNVYEFCKEVLNSKACLDRQLFKQEKIQKFIDDKKGKVERLGGNLLWELACLESWLQQFDER